MMELSTSTLFGLVAVLLIMAAVTWIVLRALPRTRGRLRAETARQDADRRRSAAALLQGWGAAGGWALAAGAAVWLIVAGGALLWTARLDPVTEDDAVPMLLGVLAPVLAALAALGVVTWTVSRRRPPEVDTGAAISAGLRPRGALSFGPRWALALPVLAAVVLCGWLVVTGLASSRDESGRFTALEAERLIPEESAVIGVVPGSAQTVSADHFPGWFVTVPAIAAALALLVLAAVLLRVLAQAPRPRGAELWGVDDLARTLKAKLVATLAGAGLVATLGAVARLTGGTMATLATLAGGERTGTSGPEFVYHEGMLSGYWIYFGGVLLGLLALLLLVVAIGAVLEFTAARHAAVSVALGEERGRQPGRHPGRLRGSSRVNG